MRLRVSLAPRTPNYPRRPARRPAHSRAAPRTASELDHLFHKRQPRSDMPLPAERAHLRPDAGRVGPRACRLPGPAAAVEPMLLARQVGHARLPEAPQFRTRSMQASAAAAGGSSNRHERFRTRPSAFSEVPRPLPAALSQQDESASEHHFQLSQSRRRARFPRSRPRSRTPQALPAWSGRPAAADGALAPPGPPLEPKRAKVGDLGHCATKKHTPQQNHAPARTSISARTAPTPVGRGAGG